MPHYIQVQYAIFKNIIFLINAIKNYYAKPNTFDELIKKIYFPIL